MVKKKAAVSAAFFFDKYPAIFCIGWRRIIQFFNQPPLIIIKPPDTRLYIILIKSFIPDLTILKIGRPFSIAFTILKYSFTPDVTVLITIGPFTITFAVPEGSLHLYDLVGIKSRFLQYFLICTAAFVNTNPFLRSVLEALFNNGMDICAGGKCEDQQQNGQKSGFHGLCGQYYIVINNNLVGLMREISLKEFAVLLFKPVRHIEFKPFAH